MKRIMWLFVLVLLAIMPVAQAQSLTELTENFAFDQGRLVVYYPQGWAIDNGETLTLASNPSVLNEALAGNSPDGSGIVFTFVTPARLGNIGITPDQSLDSAMTTLMQAAGLSGMYQTYRDVSLPALSGFVSGAEVKHGQLVAVQFDDGIVMVAIEFGSDPANFSDVVAQIVGAMNYDGQSAGTVAVNGDMIHQWASSATASSQYGSDSWSAKQATGAPNTPECGDYGTAWASSSSTGKDDLTVTFDQAVIPANIHIHQTFNPGSIIRVELIEASTGNTIALDNSPDSSGKGNCPGIFSINVTDVETHVNGVTIYFDQTIGGSWNEIDAVELVGTSDVVKSTPAPMGESLRQWANFATGTSQYGEDGWSFMQATGEPDSVDCDDSLQAWASASSGTSEILALEFEQSVIPSQVNIYQNYNPGSITRIELTNTDSSEIIPVANSADPVGNTPCPGVFTVNIEGVNAMVNGVIIYFDQSIGGSWNEIDAVELVGNLEGAENTGQAMDAVLGSLDDATFLTADYQGHFTVDYPDTWVVNLESSVASIATSEALLSIGQDEDPGTGIGIQIITPEMLAQFGVTAETAMDAISFVSNQYASTAPVVAYKGLNYTAAYSEMNGSLAPAGSYIIAIETPDGIFSFAIRTNEFDTYAPIINHIVNSIRFGQGEGVDTPPATTDDVIYTTADYEGQFTIDYPETWVIDFAGMPASIASSPEALRISPMADSGTTAGLQIVAPEMLAQLGVSADASAEDVVAVLAGQYGSTAPIEAYDGLSFVASYSEFDGDLAPEGSHIIAIETEQGVYAFAIRTTEFVTYAPIINHIIDSITFSS